MTTLFANADTTQMPLPTAETVRTPAKKNGWLPVLTVLFLISYGLMTMLVVEQGRTIESQRALIRELFRDSRDLSAVKQHGTQAPQISAPATPYSQTPSGQVPSTQAPRKQAPSTQTDPQIRTQNRSGVQKTFRAPSRPASDLAEPARTLITL